jgi:hypothetical protein
LIAKSREWIYDSYNTGPWAISGVPVDSRAARTGGRVVTTLEAGAAGNDQEVAVSHERWVSPQLRVLVLRKLLDPLREYYLETQDISLAEPDPALFRPPVDYSIKDMGHWPGR